MNDDQHAELAQDYRCYVVSELIAESQRCVLHRDLARLDVCGLLTGRPIWEVVCDE